MPSYDYECPKCLLMEEKFKHFSELDTTFEECPSCGKGQLMERRISAPRINVSVCQWNSAYNPAFGKVIHNKRHLKEELSRIKGETGKELVEVGTDTLKSIKKKHTPYTVDHIPNA